MHIYAYIINVFPSIIVFLFRYLSSDDNPLFIVTPQSKWVKKLTKIMVDHSHLIAQICFQLLLFTISQGYDSMNSKGIYGTKVCHNEQVRPDLQLISNQVMATSYSITTDEARLDITGIWDNLPMSERLIHMHPVIWIPELVHIYC